MPCTSRTSDPGISVQCVGDADAGAETRLYLVRQLLEPHGDDRLEPVGGAVCERIFPARAAGPDWHDFG